MKTITIFDNAHSIQEDSLRKIFLSKLRYLSDELLYLGRMNIEATVHFRGSVCNKRLETTIEVECDDAEFKKAIESSIQIFNSESYFVFPAKRPCLENKR